MIVCVLLFKNVVSFQEDTKQNDVALDKQRLLDAAKRGDADTVRACLASGVDVDLGDASDATPLLYASQAGHANVVTVLIEHGASVEAGAARCLAPLLLAAQDGHADVVKVLLEHGASVEASEAREPNDPRTPLLLAAKWGHHDVVLQLLEAGAKIDCQDRWHTTPLLLAIENRHIDVALTLAKRATDVNTINARYWSPLPLACKRGMHDVVAALLEAKADPDALFSSPHRRTPLMLAALNNHWSVVQLLEKAGAIFAKSNYRNETVLTAAAERALPPDDLFDYDVLVERAIASGADIDMRTTEYPESTALFLAAGNGNTRFCTALLNAKANVNLGTRKEAKTPLMAAVAGSHAEVVAQLLDAKADARQTDAAGTAAEHYAAAAGDLDIFKRMQTASIGPIIVDLRGRRAVAYAALKGHLSILEHVFNHRMGINFLQAKDVDERNAYLIAAERDQVDALRYMQAEMYSSDLAVLDRHGSSVLQIAAMHNNRRSVAFLLDHGADVNHVNTVGVSVLEAAGVLTGVEGAALFDRIKRDFVIREPLFIKNTSLRDCKPLGGGGFADTQVAMLCLRRAGEAIEVRYRTSGQMTCAW